MKLLTVVRIGVRVLLSLVGVGVALGVAVLDGPVPAGLGAAAGLVPTDTIRAWRLLRLIAAPPRPVVLPAGDFRLVQVRRVVDADTYDVQPLSGGGLARVRVVGMDAPEHDQPFGKQATDSISRKVLGAFVWVRVLGVDPYGRNLAVVRLRAVAFERPFTYSLDSLAVVRGWAWAYAPSGQVVVRNGEQQQAQTAKRGLWKCGLVGVVRPGIWRAYNRQDKASAGWGCPW